MRRRAFPRDPQATKERLLSTAERLFMEKGYDLARVDEIAAQAQVNKRMIYVYFTDKEGLYMAILDTSFSRMLTCLEAVAQDHGDPRNDAERLIRAYFQFLAEHPHFVRMVVWESLRYGRQAGRVLARTYRASLEKLYAVFQRGVDQGVLRSDLDVRKLAASVYGLCLSHFSQREFLNILSDKDSTSSEAREVALNHILRLVFDGIEKRPPSPSPSPRVDNASRR
ncbi:MAG TPA: TetR/AcrR family transcriptional regulator [Polyangia bacterium]